MLKACIDVNKRGNVYCFLSIFSPERVELTLRSAAPRPGEDSLCLPEASSSASSLRKAVQGARATVWRSLHTLHRSCTALGSWFSLAVAPLTLSSARLVLTAPALGARGWSRVPGGLLTETLDGAQWNQLDNHLEILPLEQISPKWPDWGSPNTLHIISPQGRAPPGAASRVSGVGPLPPASPRHDSAVCR